MIAKILFAAALVAVPVPAQTPPKATIVAVPPDTVARLKFPGVDGAMVDTLAAVNKLVNRAITGESDQQHYGVGEKWVMFPTDGKGDCEDYALTKLGILVNSGFPAVLNARIRGVIIHLSKGRIDGHAILELRMPDKSIMFLDNRFNEPMTRRELEARGYEFSDW